MSVRKLEARTGGRGRKGHPGLGLLAGLIVIAWIVEFIDSYFGLGLDDRYGVYPRTFVGLRGVIFMPWLHSDWGHLLDNTIALLGLGVIVILAEGRRFASTTLILALITGLGTWAIADLGQEKIQHIGASGLVYAYFGYIMARAIWGRRLVWAVVGIVVAVVYGGMIGGVLPGGDRISWEAHLVSWEAHLVGLLGGVWLGQRHA